MTSRFQVVLSFSGEHRAFVNAVANALSDKLTRQRVFYDEWYEAELLGADGDLKLEAIYKHATLVVPFFSEHYSQPWCSMEWTAIRGIFLDRKNDDAVIPVHLDNTHIPGWPLVNFGIKLRGRTPQQIADLLLQALAIRNPDAPMTSSTARPSSEESYSPSATIDSNAASIIPAAKTPIAPSRLPRTGEYLIGRSKEIKTLMRAWRSSKTNHVQIVAPGGIGKTQLVKKWREELLDKKDHGGVIRTYDWSFYVQGTQQQASADEFFDHALRWFGESEPSRLRDPWEKGAELARRVKERRTLMILDGLEPLQNPCDGRLNDPSLQTLLSALGRDNPGLCVVTTRASIPVLAEMKEPRRVTIDLSALDPPSGAELLSRYQVRGEPEELQAASREVRGHSLALILLGTLLRDRFGGDVRRRGEALLFRGAEKFAEHAHKVMASYETWFERQDDIGRAAVAILHLLGLFNRPADAGCLDALRVEPPILGLTEALFVGPREEVWHRAVERLRNARLLADEGSLSPEFQLADRQPLDCHPLIREHFARQLEAKHPRAALEAHHRLYTYLQRVVVHEFPETLDEAALLYAAVRHGCGAGKHQDALQDVYWRRLSRGPGRLALSKFGAFGSDLSALANFFDVPWRQPVAVLDEKWKAQVLDLAALNLRAQGQLLEATVPIDSSLATAIATDDWDNAAVRAGNLASIYLTLGQFPRALSHAERGVELSGKSNDEAVRVFNSVILAAVYQRAGRLTAARAMVGESIPNQTTFDFRFPIIHTLPHLFYSDLLLAEGKCEEVLRRGHEALRYVEAAATNQVGLFPIAINHLCLARSYVAQSQRIPGDDSNRAAEHLEHAMKGLRRLRAQELIASALLCRAELYGIQGDRLRAEKDLDQLRTIAERGAMLNLQVDAAVLFARIRLERTPTVSSTAASDVPSAEPKDIPAARGSLDRAKLLIRKSERPYERYLPLWQPYAEQDVFRPGELVGYRRRDAEIAALHKLLD